MNAYIYVKLAAALVQKSDFAATLGPGIIGLDWIVDET